MPLSVHHVPLCDPALPLTRSVLLATSGTRTSLCNLDDFASSEQWRQVLNLGNDASVSSKTGVSVDSRGIHVALANPLPLPESLSRRKWKYSDSRKLEAETEAFLHDFAVAKAQRLATVPEVDEDGFVTVKGGFKPEDAAKLAAREDEKLRFDFYRFQQKERKLKEWREEQIRQEEAVQEVQRLKKKRRFNL